MVCYGQWELAIKQIVYYPVMISLINHYCQALSTWIAVHDYFSLLSINDIFRIITWGQHRRFGRAI